MSVDTRPRAQKLFPRQSSKAVQFLYLLGCAENPTFLQPFHAADWAVREAAADDRRLCPDIFAPLRFGPCVNKRGGTDWRMFRVHFPPTPLHEYHCITNRPDTKWALSYMHWLTVMQITTEAHSAAQPEGRVSWWAGVFGRAMSCVKVEVHCQAAPCIRFLSSLKLGNIEGTELNL